MIPYPKLGAEAPFRPSPWPPSCPGRGKNRELGDTPRPPPKGSAQEVSSGPSRPSTSSGGTVNLKLRSWCACRTTVPVATLGAKPSQRGSPEGTPPLIGMPAMTNSLGRDVVALVWSERGLLSEGAFCGVVAIGGHLHVEVAGGCVLAGSGQDACESTYWISPCSWSNS